MKDIPQWIRRILNNEKLTCGKCSKTFSSSELFSIGIQKGTKRPQKEVLFIGLVCGSCGEMTIFELDEMGLVDFSLEILEGENSDMAENETKIKEEKLFNININMSNKKIDNEDEEEEEEDEDPREEKENSRISKRSKSKITVKEIKDVINFLEKNKSHEDFLLEMGMSLEDIEKYRVKKKGDTKE